MPRQQVASGEGGRSYEFLVLGPLLVRRDGEDLVLGGRRPRALLAALLLHANHLVSSERLAEDLWEGRPPATARAALQMHVTTLRRALGSDAPIRTGAGGYTLAVELDQVDAARFEWAVGRAREVLRAGNPRRAAAELEAAFALWRGRAFADLADASFVRLEAQRLEELRVVAEEDWVQARLACGEHAGLVGQLAQLVVENPYRERLRCQLMLALYRSGRQADALAAYRDARELLVSELGIEPGPELRELERGILAHDAGLAAPAPVTALERAEPSGGAGAAVARLPTPATPTVGREEDLARLGALVDGPSTRLTTVVGPGGVGKTRVAVELARALNETRHDGVHFVSLAPLASHEHVASAIAEGLGLTPNPGQSEQELLRRHCAARELLLVLDNFEHVLEAAPLVADLLASCPRLSVLATSREPLHLRAEHVFALAPLAVASPASATSFRDAPALELFTSIVRARRPEFELASADVAVLGEICERLDGLPLAIELAAGSLSVLSVTELATRTRHGLDGLSPGPRDAPARQRTLRATLDWSYRLLSDGERTALASLSVFAGGFTRAAAEAVAGVAVHVLEALTAKQLVTAYPTEHGLRFAMLETIREFAHERLAELPSGDDVRHRHLGHFLAFAERRAVDVRRAGLRAAAAELEREMNNLRAAFAWAVEVAATESALRLAIATAEHSSVRHGPEGDRWFIDALALPQDNVAPALRAKALTRCAPRLQFIGGLAAAESAARAGLELHEQIGDAAGRAESLTALAAVTRYRGRAEEAFAHASEAVILAREHPDPVVLSSALAWAANTAPTLAQVLAYGHEAVAAYRAVDNWAEISFVHTGLAYRAIAFGDYLEADRQVAAAVRAAITAEDEIVLGFARGNEGLSALFSGDFRRADTAFRAELELGNRLSIDFLLDEALQGLAALHAHAQHDILAATLLGAAGAIHREASDPAVLERADATFFAPSRARLGSDRWAAALAHGQRLSVAEAVKLARESRDAPEPGGTSSSPIA
jgi:predicted ATPase/DNA-binding SARP family transcriptional activator